jgi:hypothetical protein
MGCFQMAQPVSVLSELALIHPGISPQGMSPEWVIGGFRRGGTTDETTKAATRR